MKYKTEQEEFWAGKFGDEYIGRNDGINLLASKIHTFGSVFTHAGATPVAWS